MKLGRVPIEEPRHSNLALLKSGISIVSRVTLDMTRDIIPYVPFYKGS